MQSLEALLILLLAGFQLPQSSGDQPAISPYNVPPAVTTCVANEPTLSLRADTNPFYVAGDLNGDTHLDYAVLVRRRVDSKAGLLLCHGNRAGRVLLWAGRKFIWDDEMPFDAWYVLSKRDGARVLGVKARGDVLFLWRNEASNGILYWTPKGYVWRQLDD